MAETSAFSVAGSFALAPAPRMASGLPLFWFAQAAMERLSHIRLPACEPEPKSCSAQRKYFRIVSVKSSRDAELGRQWPVMGLISSGFGYRRHPVTRRRSFHAGIDIRSRYGTPIIAPSDGLVTYTGRAGANGKLVKLQCGNGVVLSFAHLRDFKCISGQWVKRGTVVGYVGATGRATGPHLHFAVQKYGQYINPLLYLGKQNL